MNDAKQMTNADHACAEMEIGFWTITQESEAHNVILELQRPDGGHFEEVFETRTEALERLAYVGIKVGEYDVDTHGIDGWSIYKEL